MRVQYAYQSFEMFIQRYLVKGKVAKHKAYRLCRIHPSCWLRLQTGERPDTRLSFWWRYSGDTDKRL